MLDQDLQDDFIISNEIERINILCEKNKYDDEQKNWFIEAKIVAAKKSNNILLLQAYSKILESLEK